MTQKSGVGSIERTNSADVKTRETLLLRDAEFAEFRSDVITVLTGFHFGVDEGNFAFRVDVERPTLRNGAAFVNNAVSFSDAFLRIA